MKYLIFLLLNFIILINILKANDIIVKLQGTGEQRFISKSAENRYAHCPNEVKYINGTKIGNNICSFNSDKEENAIVLTWYNELSGYELFLGMENIVEIYFVNCTIIESMHQIFKDCINLKSINFTGFYIDSDNPIKTNNGAFKNCKSLYSLDYSPVILLKRDFRYIFDECINLEYINFINYDESKVNSDWHIKFDDKVPNNLVICINQTLAPKLYYNLTYRACTIIYCGNDWREKQKKRIADNNTCVETCPNSGEYKYEYNNRCYKNCPEGLIEYNNKCILKDDIITYVGFNSISSISINTKEISYNFTIIENEILYAKNTKIFELKENIMNGDIDEILENITKNGEDYILKDEDNTTYQVTNTENQKNNKNNNISSINLGRCETELKKIYKINDTIPLIIFKIDYYPPDLLIPIVLYEIYHPINKSKLDLTYCKEILLELNIPVSIDENNLFKYDPNSNYYTDNCYAYTTDNGTDIILSDRQQEFIDNKLSLCENKCNYIRYEAKTKQSSCNCTAKNKIDLLSEIINPDKLSNNFNSTESLLSTSNIIIMKCVKNLFSKDGLKNNISSYILI